MTKHTPHWITIEEDGHIPKPPKQKNQSQKSDNTVTNKWFWGIGFVVVVVAALGLVAPKQFANLLQGNMLQNYQGMQLIKTDILPENQKTDFGKPTDNSDSKDEVEPTSVTNTVVQAQTDAVTVKIDLDLPGLEDVDVYVLTDKEKELDKVTNDMLPADVAQEFLNDVYSHRESSDYDSYLDELLASEMKLLEKWDEALLRIENGTLTPAPVNTVATIVDEPSDEVEVSELDKLKQELAEAKKREEEQALALAEAALALTNQLTGQVTAQVNNQAGNLHSASTHPSSTTGVITTTALGSVPTGLYRANVHRTTTSPRDVLAANQGKTVQVQTAATSVRINTQPVNVTYPHQLANASNTPDSGPKEVFAITLLLSFLSVIGWKFRKLFV